jgi:hypothetical protein
VRTAASILAILAASSIAFSGVESLRERSPFVPPAAPQKADANANALSMVELTGLLSVGGKPQFSVRDTSTGRGFWLGLGETQEGLTVQSSISACSRSTSACVRWCSALIHRSGCERARAGAPARSTWRSARPRRG